MPRTRTPRILAALAAVVSPWPYLVAAQEPAKPTETASEAAPHIPAAGHSVHGEAFDDGPRSAAVLLPGQGHGGFFVTTKAPEAQAFFNQGVAQVHTFYYLEAERSFRQAARLDPDAPMAYWGMAMANVNNARRAKAFIKEAQKKAETATISRRETLHIDGLAGLYADKGDEKGKRAEWTKALETIALEHPDDADARSWLAMALWQNAQKGDPLGSRLAVSALISSVLEIDPKHPGGIHYRIHLWDHQRPAEALKAAAEYGPAAPGIAHAWHMPGHTYSELNRHADAAYQQEASARADHAAMARDRTMPFEIHNYAHNNQWLCTSLSNIGRAREAIAVARNLVEQPRDPQKNGKNDGGSPQRSGRARWSEALVRYELWDDLIAAGESGALDWSDIPQEKKERTLALGVAYAQAGNLAKLDEQIAALRADEPKKDEPKKDDAKPDEPKKDEATSDESRPDEPKKEEPKKDDAPPAGAIAKAAGGVAKAARRAMGGGNAPAIAELEGYRHLLDGKADEAIKAFDKASGMRPEAKARVQVRLGQMDKAVATAKAAADKAPGQFSPLACLVETLNAAGKADEAREAYRKLAPMLAHADADLPVVRRLAEVASSWSSAGGWSAPSGSPEPSTGESAQGRTPLEPIGPLLWAPTRAEPFALTGTDDQAWSLADHKGRPAIVLFYLGGKCAHCMQQLQEFAKVHEEFRAMGVDVIAVGTDDLAAAKELKANPEVAFPMPLLADPKLDSFRAYRCFDDFEDAPLHGTFLIDAKGDVRFRRISAEPFLDVKFLKEEAARVQRLVRP